MKMDVFWDLIPCSTADSGYPDDGGSKLLGKDVEASYRDLIRGTLPLIVRSDLGRAREAGLWDEIWSRNLPNVKKWCLLVNLTSSFNA